MTVAIGVRCPEGVVLAVDAYTPRIVAGQPAVQLASKLRWFPGRRTACVLSGRFLTADTFGLTREIPSPPYGGRWNFPRACMDVVTAAARSQSAVDAGQLDRALLPAKAVDGGAYPAPSLLAIDFSQMPSIVKLFGAKVRHVRSGTGTAVIGAFHDGVAPDVEVELTANPGGTITECHHRVVDWMWRYLAAYPASREAQQLQKLGVPLEVGFPFEVITMDADDLTVELYGPDVATHAPR
jgi:hypothetical protein